MRELPVPAILDLFSEYGIHATWAVVGFLFFDHTRALIEHAPALRPSYYDTKLSPYDDLPPDDARADSDSIFFAPGLIRTNKQDQSSGNSATHTFSHYYCLESGQTLRRFARICRPRAPLLNNSACQ